jgi:hypothetical protein
VHSSRLGRSKTIFDVKILLQTPLNSRIVHRLKMNCKLFVKIFSDITLHSYYFSVALWERRGLGVLHAA